MAHDECIQTRRLFIIERDIAAEIAKYREYEEHTHDLLVKISKEIAGLSDNMARKLQSLEKEVSNLTKLVKKSNT